MVACKRTMRTVLDERETTPTTARKEVGLTHASFLRSKRSTGLSRKDYILEMPRRSLPDHARSPPARIPTGCLWAGDRDVFPGLSVLPEGRSIHRGIPRWVRGIPSDVAYRRGTGEVSSSAAIHGVPLVGYLALCSSKTGLVPPAFAKGSHGRVFDTPVIQPRGAHEAFSGPP